MLSFNILSLSDSEIISNFVKDFRPYSDFNFLSLYSWSFHSQTKFCLFNNALFLIMSDYTTTKKIFTFISHKPAVNLELYIDWLKKQDTPITLSLLPDFMIPSIENYLKQADKVYKLTEDRDAFDYIIKIRKIVETQGPEYADFRYKLSKFNKLWGHRIKAVSFNPKRLQDVKKAAALANRWANRKKLKNEVYEYELYAFNRFLLAARDVDSLRFCAYELDGELVGLVAAEKLGNGYAIGHFLKYDPDVFGIYYHLVKAICLQLHEEKIDFINIEQDLGNPGLREAKMHLRPVNFLKKFTLEIGVGY